MSEVTAQLYEQLLKQFYRKAIRTHPNRHDLITKFIKLSIGLKQDRGIDSQNNITSSTRNRPKLNVLTISQNPKAKFQSSREIEPPSPRYSNHLSEDKSSYSGDSDIQKSSRRNRQQQKYFNCEWIYKSNNFKKTLVFSFVHLYFQINDFYNFRKLRDNIEIYFEENKYLDAQIKNGALQWNKLDQTFEKKDRVRWSKILPEIFINFPVPFINVIFECLTRVKAEDIRSPSKEAIDLISRNLKVNVGYFEIFHLDIQKQTEKTQVYKIDINIGYIKQEDLFVFSNRYPQKSQQEKKKDKTIFNISESIANLLKEYDSNTEKLMSLNILSDSSSKEANIKNYLNKKDTLK